MMFYEHNPCEKPKIYKENLLTRDRQDRKDQLAEIKRAIADDDANGGQAERFFTDHRFGQLTKVERSHVASLVFNRWRESDSKTLDQLYNIDYVIRHFWPNDDIEPRLLFRTEVGRDWNNGWREIYIQFLTFYNRKMKDDNVLVELMLKYVCVQIPDIKAPCHVCRFVGPDEKLQTKRRFLWTNPVQEARHRTRIVNVWQRLADMFYKDYFKH